MDRMDRNKRYCSALTSHRRRDGDSSEFCDHPNCVGKRQYPAPKSRHNLRDYFFFCLEHVRIYNKNWNYYVGMSASQIEADRYADIFGWQSSPEHWGEAKQASHRVVDAMDVPDFAYAQYDEPVRTAIQILKPALPIGLASIKTAYKRWVKQLHPDINPQTAHAPQAQEQLRQINQAYTILKLAFTT